MLLVLEAERNQTMLCWWSGERAGGRDAVLTAIIPVIKAQDGIFPLLSLSA